MPVPKGVRYGGRKRGTPNKNPLERVKKTLPREVFESLSQMDRKDGKSMAEIQIKWARSIDLLADAERAKASAAAEQGIDDAPFLERTVKYAGIATKIAHDVSAYLYPALQSIKHSGDEDAPPIRIESLSDFQLEQLIKRLSRG